MIKTLKILNLNKKLINYLIIIFLNFLDILQKD
jgi:hypothetical protein